MERDVKDHKDGGEINDNKTKHGNNLTDFQSSWKQFDNIGSNLLVQLCGSLVGSQYHSVTKEIVALLGPVFACGESELVLSHLKEIESLMPGNQQCWTGNVSPEEDKVNIFYQNSYFESLTSFLSLR